MPLMPTPTPLRGHSLGRPHAPLHRTTVVAGCGFGERDAASRRHMAADDALGMNVCLERRSEIIPSNLSAQ